MRQTNLYRLLEARLRTLEHRYIPAINLLGKYSTSELDDTRAYTLLAHAEIEHYLEQLGERVATMCFNAYQIKNKVSHAVLSLVASSKTRLEVENKSGIKIDKVVHKAYSAYRAAVAQNNGLKEKNLMVLFTPLNIPLSSTLQVELTILGEQRGEMAHRSALSITTQLIPDPQDHLKRVHLILQELASVDRACRRLV